MSILYTDCDEYGVGLNNGICFSTVWDNELGIVSGINFIHYKVKDLAYATTDFFNFRLDQTYDMLEIPFDLTIDILSQENPPLISPVLTFGGAFSFVYRATEIYVYDDSTRSYNFTEYESYYNKYNLIWRLGLLFRLNISEDLNILFGSTVRFVHFQDLEKSLTNISCFVGIVIPLKGSYWY